MIFVIYKPSTDPTSNEIKWKTACDLSNLCTDNQDS